MCIGTALGAPTCATSGERQGCSMKQTFPCSWTDHQCEFQYDSLFFVCEATPDNSAVSVSCVPTDNSKQYDVEVLDAIQFGTKNSWIPTYTCANEDACATWSTGPYAWSGVLDYNITNDVEPTPMSLYTTVSMVDHNSCLDVTCTITVS